MKSFLTKNSFIILIIFFGGLLRFWELGVNPPSLFVDEVSNGYNAYSILKTGKDEYGNFLPITIKSFGDYNPALSVYLLIPSIAIFGLNEIGVRFPSAILGTLSIFLTYLLVLKIFKERKIALMASVLFAISPWHLQFSRYDHEANFMVFFGILGLTLFLRSFKKYLLLIISAISFGLAFNTYQGAKVWIPLLILAIIFWYRTDLVKFKERLILPLLILFLFVLPVILNFQQSLIRGQSVGIFGAGKDTLDLFISGYLAHFSPNFLFVSGDSIGRHSVGGMGEFYVFEIPLIILGLLMLIKMKTRGTKFLLTWLLLAPIPAALATPAPHALRSIAFLPLWSILSACGFKSIATSSINSKFKLAIVAAILVVGIYNFLTYLHLYYKHYPKLKAFDWGGGYKEMVLFVDKVKNNYETIAVSNYYGWPYIYFLFYTKYDPQLYHFRSYDKTKIDKIEFFGQSWEKKTSGKALIIRPAWQVPNPAPKYLKFIYANNGELVFRISEEE